jgi:hypothetical protein
MTISANTPNLMPFIIFLVVLPLSLYLSYRRNESNRKKLREVALKLGLQYTEKAPLDPSVKSATIRTGDQIRAQQRLRQLNGGGILSRVSSLMSAAAVTGKYNGFAVDIRTANQNKKTYTVFSVYFPAALGLGLRITGNSLFRRDLPFGNKARIETGSDEFDKRIYVKGNDEMRVKYLIKRPEVQNALLAAYRIQSDTVIDDSAIVCRVEGFQGEFAKCQAILGGLTAVAQQLKAN